MRKKLFIIFLAAILGLMFFNTDFCLALNEPVVPDEKPAAGEASVILKWSWSEGGDGELKQFKILYKEEKLSSWTAVYPIAETGNITYNLMGISEGTYQWRIKAEAQDPANDSEFVDGTIFEITAASKGNGGNGNSDGGFLQDIPLENPLQKDTLFEAIDAVLNFLIIAAFAIAPILIIYASFLMIFAAGNAAKISRAKEIILWTVIAVAIILFAKGLPSVIKGMFSEQSSL